MKKSWLETPNNSHASKAAPSKTNNLRVIGEKDVIIDLDGNGHSPIELGEGRFSTSEILTTVAVFDNGIEFIVKPGDLKAAKEFATTVIKPQQIENAFNRAEKDVELFRITGSWEMSLPPEYEVTRTMYEIAVDGLNSNASKEDIKKRMGAVFDAKVESLKPDALIDAYFRSKKSQNAIHFEGSALLSKEDFSTRINAKDEASSEILRTKDGLDYIFHLLATSYSGDKKTPEAVKKSMQALPEWARLIAEEEGVVVSTLATNKTNEIARGVSYYAQMLHQPLHIFIKAESALTSSKEALAKTAREEVIHSLQSRSDTRWELLEITDFEVFERGGKKQALEKALSGLHTEMLANPEKKLQVETLIKMTEPHGGSLLNKGWDSEIAAAELLVDVCDAEVYLRRKMGKSSEETTAQLEAVFSKPVVAAVRAYQDEWMEEAAGIAQKRYGAEKAAALHAKWKTDPIAHELEIPVDSAVARVSGRLKPKRHRE